MTYTDPSQRPVTIVRRSSSVWWAAAAVGNTLGAESGSRLGHRLEAGPWWGVRASNR